MPMKESEPAQEEIEGTKMCSGPTSWTHPAVPALIHDCQPPLHPQPRVRSLKFMSTGQHLETSVFLAAQWLAQRRIPNVGGNMNGKVRPSAPVRTASPPLPRPQLILP